MTQAVAVHHVRPNDHRGAGATRTNIHKANAKKPGILVALHERAQGGGVIFVFFDCHGF